MNFLFRLVATLALFTVLTACASLQRATTSTATPTVHYAAVALPEPIVELPAPIPELPEFPIRIRELHERATVRFTPQEIHCMTEVIYREAGGESEVGQVGVGYVVLNRMGHASYPATACGVIHDRKHGVQFSWAAPNKRLSPIPLKQYEKAERVALLVMNRVVENPVDDSLFFRHRSIRGSTKQVLRTTIGNHGFFALT